jgi:eukaryotic-like serine/threonine-protein kinase
MSPPPLIPGFRMGELLGEGAASTVYAAVNARGDELAMKVLREPLGAKAETVARFRREAEIAAQLRCPYIAQVVAAGRHGDRYWIAYPRLHGETLASRLGRETVLPPQALALLVDQILCGLGVAHTAGVVHRDIKPGNVMIGSTRREDAVERALILDFGLSKSAIGEAGDAREPSLTSTTATLGTVKYMPPEQIGGAASVDHRADLYAAGVVAYRALSGRLPHVGTSRAVVLIAKRDEDARSLASTTGLPWPTWTEAFFQQALARDPDARFGSAEAMRKAWQVAVQAHGMPSTEALRRAKGRPEDDDDTELDGDSV